MGAALAQTTAEEAAATLALVPDASPETREGAILYDHHCSACHGDTGRGLAEAKASFPADDRNCTRCHQEHNPPQMAAGAMTYRNAFDIGDPPPLLGEDGALSRYRHAAGLFGYVRATMPRPFPGALEDEAYWKIVAFLAAAAGAELPSGPLGPATGTEVPLP